METVVIGGGVAANRELRATVAARASESGLRAVIPSRALCTDNAAMIGAAALGRLALGGSSSGTGLGTAVSPNLRLS